jgi:hypothetical protein
MTDNLPAPVAPSKTASPLGRVVAPARLPELGAIRFGEQVEGGSHPRALEKPRLTSNDEALLARAAEVYGGDVQPWTNPATGEVAFEVYTDVTALDVLVPVGMGVTVLDQVYEQYRRGYRSAWSDGERVHWFDEQNHWRERPVEGDELSGGDWSRVTRLRLMLADVPGVGVWTLSTTSAYAASELPATIAYLAQMTIDGRPVSGRLILKRRTQRKMAEGEGPQSRTFGYPFLDIAAQTPRQMLEERAEHLAQLEAGATAEDPRAALNAPQVNAEPVLIFAGALGNVTDPGPGDPADGKARREVFVALVKQHDLPHADVKAALAGRDLQGASAASFADLEHGDQAFRSAILALGDAAETLAEGEAPPDEPETVDGEAEEVPEPTEESQTIPGTEAPTAYTDPE